MRKTLLLLATLLSTVGAWADVTDFPVLSTVENPVYYVIHNTRSTSGKFMYFDGTTVKDRNPAALTDAYKFYFTGDDYNNVKIHNAAAGAKMLKNADTWDETGATCVLAITENDSKAGLTIWLGDTYLNERNYDNGYTTWTDSKDAGSIFVFEPVDEVVLPECPVTVGQLYTIECPLFENTQGVKKGLYETNDGKLAWGTFDKASKDRNFYWIPAVTPLGYIAFKNYGTNKYIAGTNMSSDMVGVYIAPLGEDQYNLVTNGTTMHANQHSNGWGNGSNIVSWSGTANSASAWKFEEQIDPEKLIVADLTYTVTYKGETKLKETVKAIVGDEYPAVPGTYPFGVEAKKPAGVISASDIKDGKIERTIEVTITLPFEPASTRNEVTNWYHMRIRPDASNNNPLYYDASNTTHMDANKKEVDMANLQNYAWGFVGDPYTGFQIVNLAAGESKVLTSAFPSKDEIYPIMGDGNQVWDFYASTNAENGFYIAYDGTNYRLNKQKNKVCYWLKGADIGSTFVVEKIADALLTNITPAADQKGFAGTAGYYQTLPTNVSLTFAAAITSFSTTMDSEGNDDVAREQKTIASDKIVVSGKEVIVNIDPADIADCKTYTLNYTATYVDGSQTTGYVKYFISLPKPTDPTEIAKYTALEEAIAKYRAIYDNEVASDTRVGAYDTKNLNTAKEAIAAAQRIVDDPSKDGDAHVEAKDKLEAIMATVVRNQFATGAIYKIINMEKTLIDANKNKAIYDVEGTPMWAELDPHNLLFFWTYKAIDENDPTAGYALENNSTSNYIASATTTSTDPVAVTINELSVNGQYNIIAGGDTFNPLYWRTEAAGSLCNWAETTPNGASAWKFELATEEEIEAIEKYFEEITAELLQEANALLAMTGMGYPKADAAARLALMDAMVDVSSTSDVEELKQALRAYKLCDDVELPEDGKSYIIKFIYGNGAEDFLCNDNSKLVHADTLDVTNRESYVFDCHINATGRYQFTNSGLYMAYTAEGNENDFEQTVSKKSIWSVQRAQSPSYGTNVKKFNIGDFFGRLELYSPFSNRVLLPNMATGKFHSEATPSRWYGVGVDEHSYTCVFIETEHYGDITTGITGVVDGENEDAAVYDLTGRKVNNIVKGGIYVKNGKKYIAK